MYQILKTARGDMVKRTDADGTIWHFPMSEDNLDYRTYLAWVAEGNTAEVVKP